MRSIERTLLGWIFGALALGSMLVAFATYLVTLDEMNEVFDADLKNIAQAVAAYHHAGHGPHEASPVALPERKDVPDDSEVVTLTWTPAGERVFASDPRVAVPFSKQEGLSRIHVGAEEWIVYTVVCDDGVAQAAQRHSARQEMAGESAAKVFPPLIGLTLVVGGLLVFGLRRGLHPLDLAAQDVAERSVHSLDPIRVEETPRELSPLVRSINELLARLGQALGAQRRFLADAAHELRTPLTALRLQLQLLERSRNEPERREAMADLSQGIERSQRLVEQLLQVARAEPDAELQQVEDVDLSALVRAMVAAQSVQAEHLGLDLGAQVDTPVRVRGSAAQLSALIGNLLDNALRYTPAGGVIDVSTAIQGDRRPVLRVRDTGPGIPSAERSRVFDRFYRGELAPEQARDGGGSGLGLAIVKAIADRHGAEVRLSDAHEAVSGLMVEVIFPESKA